MFVFSAGIPRTGSQSTVRCVVYIISEAGDLAGFGGDDGAGDVADTGNRYQELQHRGRTKLPLEVLLEKFLVGAYLQALLVIHQERHPVLLRDGAVCEEVGKGRL